LQSVNDLGIVEHIRLTLSSMLIITIDLKFVALFKILVKIIPNCSS